MREMSGTAPVTLQDKQRILNVSSSPTRAQLTADDQEKSCLLPDQVKDSKTIDLVMQPNEKKKKIQSKPKI